MDNKHYMTRLFAVLCIGIVAVCQISEPAIVPSAIQRAVLGGIVLALSCMAITPIRNK